jgi:excisionase family DNA binding protein
MMNTLLERPDTVVPTAEDAELAATASRAIAKTKDMRTELRVRVNDTELTLPSAAKDLLFHLLKEMAQGNAVTLIPIHAELTTQEAADVLNVSRPHLIKLIEEGKLLHHKVGTHRRIKFRDLEAYKASFEAQRQRAMEALAKQAQELEMGY